MKSWKIPSRISSEVSERPTVEESQPKLMVIGGILEAIPEQNQ